MWKLYDDLYIGIPSGVRIESCTIGKDWTAVRANGNVGVARTLEGPEDPLGYAAKFKGAYLRETASHLAWDSLARASVGVAAMNAWYNTKERAEGLGGLGARGKLTGKVAYVGDFEEANSFPLPMGPGFERAGYERLKEFDTVVVCACALITRALPGILDIVGESGNVVIEGYSLPCSALFFAFGMPVRELWGYYPASLEAFESRAVKEIREPAGALGFAVRSEEVKRIREEARLTRQ